MNTEFPKSRLSELRKKHKLTQEKLAEQLNINKNTLSAVETSRRPLPIDKGIEIAKAFHVSLDWLYGLKENESTNVLDSFSSFFSLGKREIFVVDKTIPPREFLTVCLSQAAKDYFLAINEIEKTKKEKDLPEAAYIAWVESVKATYIKKIEENQTGEMVEFVLIQNTENFGLDVAYAQARRELPDLAAKKHLDELNYGKM